MDILNAKQVIEKTGLSRTTIWRLERIGNFPKRIALSERRIGWKLKEIEEWLASRPQIERGD
jgi:predicted DNA-binding transcriptional regulator AlpA